MCCVCVCCVCVYVCLVCVLCMYVCVHMSVCLCVLVHRGGLKLKFSVYALRHGPSLNSEFALSASKFLPGVPFLCLHQAGIMGGPPYLPGFYVGSRQPSSLCRFLCSKHFP